MKTETLNYGGRSVASDTPLRSLVRMDAREQYYAFTRNGKKEYTGCKQCAIALDDNAEYGDHA